MHLFSTISNCQSTASISIDLLRLSRFILGSGSGESRLLLRRRSSSDEFLSRFILGAGSGVTFLFRRGSSSDESSSSDELEESDNSFFFAAISLRNFSLVLLAASSSESIASSEESELELEDFLFELFCPRACSLRAGSGEEESRRLSL